MGMLYEVICRCTCGSEEEEGSPEQRTEALLRICREQAECKLRNGTGNKIRGNIAVEEAHNTVRS